MQKGCAHILTKKNKKMNATEMCHNNPKKNKTKKISRKKVNATWTCTRHTKTKEFKKNLMI